MVMLSWNTEQQVERFIEGKASIKQLIEWCPVDAVDDLVQHIKSEANRYWNIDPNVSFKLAETIIAFGEAYDNVSHVALGTMARGDARKNLGEFQAAWDDLQEAARLYNAIRDEVGWARTRIGLVWICVELNRVESALVDAVRAEDIFIEHQGWNWLISLYMNLGTIHNWLGKFNEALQYLQDAVNASLKLGSAGDAYLGRLYLNIGYTYQSMNDFRQAKHYFNQAQRLFEKRGEDFNIVYVHQNLAYLAETTGHLRQALRLLHSVLPQLEGQSPLQAIQIRRKIESCYLKLNRYTEARDLAKQIIIDCEKQDAGYMQALAVLDLAKAEAALSAYDAAHHALEEVEQMYRELGTDLWRAEVDIWRAVIALKQNRVEIAESQARQAAGTLLAKSQYFQGIGALLVQGQALHTKGDSEEAFEIADQALRLARKYQHAIHRYGAYLLLGQICEDLGDFRRAKRHYQAAVATVDRVQKNLTITLRSDFLQDKNEAFRSLLGLHLTSGNMQSAFEALERAKSQVFFGYLSSRDSLVWTDEHPRSKQLLDELQTLREEHLWFYRILQDEPHQTGETATVTPEEARHELAIREKQMRQITEQLYLYAGDTHTEVNLPSLADIQACLGEDTCVVEYYNDGSQIWAFVVTREQATVHKLWVSVNQLDQWLAKFQFNVSCALKAGAHSPVTSKITQQAKQLARQFYAALIKPLGEGMRRYARLVIVPYGNLHYLPFNLLCTDHEYLIERSEVVVLPAASLLARRNLQRPQRALVLAHSHNGLLPRTISEGKLVSDLLGGDFKCNQHARRGMLQDSPGQVLHIAAHGEFRMDQPDLSFIHLEDGPLYTDDLLQHDLSYELITLSACETGRANVAPGDELIGLGRGCLYAGASALLVTQWRVEDVTALTLMESFYRALLSGKSKAAAIRDAQCSLLAENPSLHPAFWGAFQLIGNASPLSTT